MAELEPDPKALREVIEAHEKLDPPGQVLIVSETSTTLDMGIVTDKERFYDLNDLGVRP